LKLRRTVTRIPGYGCGGLKQARNALETSPAVWSGGFDVSGGGVCAFVDTANNKSNGRDATKA